MDASFIPIETIPSKTPFGLDQLRRSYKTALSAEDAIAAAPAVGDADESFPNMFLMPISTPEAAESATRVDLVYMGSLQGAEGSPTLPAQKHDYDDDVQSASSSRLNTNDVLTGAITAQYYAPTSTLSYISFGGPGTEVADDPVDDPRVITITMGDTTFSIGTVTDDIIAAAFTIQIVGTFKSSEIVPGQYYQNVSRKTKVLSPWIYDLVPGPYISLYSPGVGYAVGNTLTISAGGESAVIVLTTVSTPGGGLFTGQWTESSNTFTAPHSAVYSTGGSGTGAGFNIMIIA